MLKLEKQREKLLDWFLWIFLTVLYLLSVPAGF